jgi:hypothetical protein
MRVLTEVGSMIRAAENAANPQADFEGGVFDSQYPPQKMVLRGNLGN